MITIDCTKINIIINLKSGHTTDAIVVINAEESANQMQLFASTYKEKQMLQRSLDMILLL